MVKNYSNVVLGPEGRSESKRLQVGIFSAVRGWFSQGPVGSACEEASESGVVLYQSVSLKLITSSGATHRLRAKSRKEVDAAATAKSKVGAKHGDRKPAES